MSEETCVSDELSLSDTECASKGLWAAYRSTLVDVTVRDTVRRIGQVDRGGDVWDLGVDQAWIMTACNPRSEPLSEAVNIARHQALGAELAEAGITAMLNVGYDPADPTWSEPGYTLPGADMATAVDLARRWEQNAVFGWFPDRWEIVGVLLPGHLVHGWRWR